MKPLKRKLKPKKNNLHTFGPISIFLLSLAVLLAGCRGGGGNVPTPGIYKPPTPAPATSPTPDQSSITPTNTPKTCNDYLSFVEDVSIPDGTVVEPGERLVKEWKVENTGDCNWRAGYTMQFIDGSDLGAPHTMALYPARKGTQPILQIIFTAPQEPGPYTSRWQAFNPAGEPFGEDFFIKIVVEEG
ncbi:MAG: hypothetical protein MAG431_02421 [Chloroflexi bacterium]|nr:hypothetical protein [Chloroflexota bacterium]